MFLFAATVALGAFLLFLVEPLAARLLLPLFGGTSAVWLTSLLFFQVALLAGYLFADAAVRKLRPRAQARAYLALLALAALTLPLDAAPALPPLLSSAPPALQLLLLLARAAGLPFVALAATGPIAQSLWSRRRTGSPYRLYALSNLASLLGLASYPFLVEPLFTLHAQALLFSLGFLVFALFATALIAPDLKPQTRQEESPQLAPSRGLEPSKQAVTLDLSDSRRARTLWLLLPACSSALLLAVTAHLTRNVAPIPLLWMLPLAAYLLSFILCFDSPRWVSRAWSVPAALVSLALLAFAEGWIPPDTHLAFSIAGITLAFFLAVAALHGELVRLRPPASRLTRFYLSLALGGALGSLAVAALIPLLFNHLVELSLSLIASALTLVAAWWPELKARPKHSLSLRAALFIGIAVMSLGLLLSTFSRALGNVFVGRNFYGALQVQDQRAQRGRLRVLFNGTTMHGVQLFTPAPSVEMLAYYSSSSGVGRAISALRAGAKPLHVGAIGLGAGILAGACRPGDRFDFYEINPLVIRIAREQFTFLAHCPDEAVHLGDARLFLASQPPQQLDLLVVDAFNSDSIPVHLLTAEAFALYARHLAPRGILAVHLSNRYLDLGPSVAAHAAPLNLHALLLVEHAQDDDIFSNEWLLLSRDPNSLDGPAYSGAKYQRLEDLPRVREWTDDYSNIASAFR